MCYLFVSKQTNNIAHGVRGARTHAVAVVQRRPNLVRFAFVLRKIIKNQKSKQKFPYGQSSRPNWIGFVFAMLDRDSNVKK